MSNFENDSDSSSSDTVTSDYFLNLLNDNRSTARITKKLYDFRSIDHTFNVTLVQQPNKNDQSNNELNKPIPETVVKVMFPEKNKKSKPSVSKRLDMSPKSDPKIKSFTPIELFRYSHFNNSKLNNFSTPKGRPNTQTFTCPISPIRNEARTNKSKANRKSIKTPGSPQHKSINEYCSFHSNSRRSSNQKTSIKSRYMSIASVANGNKLSPPTITSSNTVQDAKSMSITNLENNQSSLSSDSSKEIPNINEETSFHVSRLTCSIDKRKQLNVDRRNSRLSGNSDSSIDHAFGRGVMNLTLSGSEYESDHVNDICLDQEGKTTPMSKSLEEYEVAPTQEANDVLQLIVNDNIGQEKLAKVATRTKSKPSKNCQKVGERQSSRLKARLLVADSSIPTTTSQKSKIPKAIPETDLKHSDQISHKSHELTQHNKTVANTTKVKPPSTLTDKSEINPNVDEIVTTKNHYLTRLNKSVANKINDQLPLSVIDKQDSNTNADESITTKSHELTRLIKSTARQKSLRITRQKSLRITRQKSLRLTNKQDSNTNVETEFDRRSHGPTEAEKLSTSNGQAPKIELSNPNPDVRYTKTGRKATHTKKLKNSKPNSGIKKITQKSSAKINIVSKSDSEHSTQPTTSCNTGLRRSSRSPKPMHTYWLNERLKIPVIRNIHELDVMYDSRIPIILMPPKMLRSTEMRTLLKDVSNRLIPLKNKKLVLRN